MHVNAGELRHRIRIVRIDRVEDEDGYTVPQEKIVHACWAKVSYTSGTEMVKANADFGEVKARFLIRWTAAAIDRKMLVRHGGRDYEIQYINDYGRPREYLEIWGVWKSTEG